MASMNEPSSSLAAQRQPGITSSLRNLEDPHQKALQLHDKAIRPHPSESLDNDPNSKESANALKQLAATLGTFVKENPERRTTSTPSSLSNSSVVSGFSSPQSSGFDRTNSPQSNDTPSTEPCSCHPSSPIGVPPPIPVPILYQPPMAGAESPLMSESPSAASYASGMSLDFESEDLQGLVETSQVSPSDYLQTFIQTTQGSPYHSSGSCSHADYPASTTGYCRTWARDTPLAIWDSEEDNTSVGAMSAEDDGQGFGLHTTGGYVSDMGDY